MIHTFNNLIKTAYMRLDFNILNYLEVYQYYKVSLLSSVSVFFENQNKTKYYNSNGILFTICN